MYRKKSDIEEKAVKTFNTFNTFNTRNLVLSELNLNEDRYILSASKSKENI